MERVLHAGREECPPKECVSYTVKVSATQRMWLAVTMEMKSDIKYILCEGPYEATFPAHLYETRAVIGSGL